MSRLAWAEILRRYSCEWLLLAETEDDHDGNIGSARVLDHDRSALTLLDRTGLIPGATLIHTAGRPLCITPAFSSRKRCSERVAKSCHDPIARGMRFGDDLMVGSILMVGKRRPARTRCAAF